MFRNNVAGSYKLAQKFPGDGSIEVRDGSIWVHSKCCNGHIQYVQIFTRFYGLVEGAGGGGGGGGGVGCVG